MIILFGWRQISAALSQHYTFIVYYCIACKQQYITQSTFRQLDCICSIFLFSAEEKKILKAKKEKSSFFSVNFADKNFVPIWHIDCWFFDNSWFIFDGFPFVVTTDLVSIRKIPLAFEETILLLFGLFSVIKCWSYCFTEKYCHLVCHIFIFYCSFS